MDKSWRTQAQREGTQGIAAQRAKKLLELARAVYSEEPLLAARYITLARKLAMRHRLPLGSKEFCRKCKTVWIPGKTLKVRTTTKGAKVIYTCLNCGALRTFGYLKERRVRKQGIFVKPSRKSPTRSNKSSYIKLSRA